jgi:hypothetical protein
MQSIREVWSVIPSEYGGELRLIDTATVLLDRWLAMVALKYCRARVWEKAMRLLQSRTATDINTVVDALNSHSTALAQRIAVAPILKFDAVQLLVATSRRRHYSDRSGRADVRLGPVDEILSCDDAMTTPGWPVGDDFAPAVLSSDLLKPTPPRSGACGPGASEQSGRRRVDAWSLILRLLR